MVLDAVYSPHWLTADSALLAGQHQSFADVNDNEVTSSGQCWTVHLLLLSFAIVYEQHSLLESLSFDVIVTVVIVIIITVIIVHHHHPAPLYLRTLWHCTNAVIIIIICCSRHCHHMLSSSSFIVHT